MMMSKLKIRLILSLLLLMMLTMPLGLGQVQNVKITVTLEGRPTDAQIKVYRGKELATVAYTDVHEIGVASFSLASGSYTMLIDHGGGFTGAIISKDVDLRGSLELTVEVERIFEPNAWGYYSADTHNHTEVSPDGNTPVDQSVGVQLAADLDLVFISDHNSVRGHRKFAAAAQERGVPYLLSEEVTTDWSIINMGHFNVYSLEPGMLVSWNVPPAQIFAEARRKGAEIVQVNHPKSGEFDYFNLMDDPRWDPGFDVAEVYNGEFSLEDELAVEQMFAFWNEGKRYVAVAASDAHMWKVLDVEYGRPRTYVYVEGELTEDKWLKSLKAGRAFVTYGPLIDLKANGKLPGETVSLKRGEAIKLEAKLYSTTALARAEIIRDGEVIAELELEGRTDAISFEERPETSGWYAVRVFEADGDRALTNPVWVEVEE